MKQGFVWHDLSPRVHFAGAGLSYERVDSETFAEIQAGVEVTVALRALRKLFLSASLDSENIGIGRWNPLGDLVRPGDRVVLKPNWVHHRNFGSADHECLVTHTSLIEAVLVYLAKTHPGKVVIGDAPIQGCDWRKLLDVNGVGEMLGRMAQMGLEVEVCDFRRTVMVRSGGSWSVKQNCRPMEEYVLFDLGEKSLVEPITTTEPKFRVTLYDPDLLRERHQQGRHEYLIAREILDADVVFNLPKLKTHKKAGITAALKNMVGMNGHKEFLPHHRKGGSKGGGDCYQGMRPLKALAETLLDTANRKKEGSGPGIGSLLSAILLKGDTLLGGDGNLEGSWYGNDTVWRMALDLQAILHYGGLDGTMANGDQPVRRVVTIADGIVAGEGDGPLAPEPVGLGVVTMGISTAAQEYLHCLLMGLDPERIPLVRGAFRMARWPLIQPGALDPEVFFEGERVSRESIVGHHGVHFRLPDLWKGHCEL